MLFRKDSSHWKNKHCLRVKGWEKVFQANAPYKHAEVVISDKEDFRWKDNVRRDNEGHFMLIKGTIHQKEISIFNIYSSNIGAPNYKKRTLMDLRAQRDPSTVIEWETWITHCHQ
jgi:hypothetical protein